MIFVGVVPKRFRIIQNDKYVSHSQAKFIDEIIEITGDRSKQKLLGLNEEEKLRNSFWSVIMGVKPNSSKYIF